MIDNVVNMIEGTPASLTPRYQKQSRQRTSSGQHRPTRTFPRNEKRQGFRRRRLHLALQGSPYRHPSRPVFHEIS